jgi:hypothetical protein
MRIGILFMGNESDRIWGGSVITYHLASALKELGHDVWRKPALSWPAWVDVLSIQSDLLILHGVPATRVPLEVLSCCNVSIYWWLTELFYNDQAIRLSGFDGIATNSSEAASKLNRLGKYARLIELAAPAESAIAAPRTEYRTFSTYLGQFPHKSPSQMDLMLGPASEHGLAIWGRGWESSPYKQFHRGILPLLEVGHLYRSAEVVLALTEERQKKRGMINNRIFEAIISGSVVISDEFPLLERHELGRYVHFSVSSSHTKQLLGASSSPAFKSLAVEGRDLVLARHTYAHRAKEMLDFYEEISSKKSQQRRNMFRPSHNRTQALPQGMFEIDRLAITIAPQGGRPFAPKRWWGLKNLSRYTRADCPDQLGIRVTYPEGSASPTVYHKWGAPLGGAHFLVDLPHGPRKRCHLRYYVRFSQDFEFVKGGKLPGLFGGTQWCGRQIPDGTNGFSTRYMWRAAGEGEVYAYLPSCDNFGLSFGRGRWQFRPGYWHLLEQSIELNDTGARNGSIKTWLDENLVLDEEGLVFRTCDDLLIDGIAFSTFFGGEDPSWCTPKTVHIDFAGFRTSDDYIGIEPYLMN